MWNFTLIFVMVRFLGSVPIEWTADYFIVVCHNYCLFVLNRKIGRLMNLDHSFNETYYYIIWTAVCYLICFVIWKMNNTYLFTCEWCQWTIHSSVIIKSSNKKILVWFWMARSCHSYYSSLLYVRNIIFKWERVSNEWKPTCGKIFSIYIYLRLHCI